jgi:hypothetical protein
MRVFVSYKRGVEPDQLVVSQVVRALESRHTVFLDEKILPSVDWGRWIEERIRESHFLIAFLTAQSVVSEMVKAEIELAYTLAQQHGHPRIVPVRLAYHDDFVYPLSAYLNRIQWAQWNSLEDTPRLLDQLQQVIEGHSVADQTTGVGRPGRASPDPIPPPTPAAQPRQPDTSFELLDSPEGTIDPQSRFYVLRSSDRVASDAITRQGSTITIKGPRQMGKSSLLLRTLERAVTAGKRAVFLDFQLIERDTLTDADRFYRGFCEWVTDELDVENKVEEYWKSPLGNSQRCTRYFSRHLLKEPAGPLVLAMDEVENLFDTAFRSDFFSMLRSWHNARANLATPSWRQLDLILVTSTEPYQLIENLNQSPFNVGDVITLDDFTAAEVADLNLRHGAPLGDAEQGRLMALLGGQPYLTRRAFYLVATHRITAADLFATAADEQGPFGDHLRYHLFRIHNRPELIRGVCDVIRRGTCDDEHLFFRMRGAGLVRRVGRTVQPRCQLYEQFFQAHLPCPAR